MSLWSSSLAILIGLISQRVFIDTLGTEYLGINGLFTSLVSMLALAELGLGSAIYFHLYKPVAAKNTEKIKSLLNFYKNGYRIIALTVFSLGLLVIPFLNLLVGDVNIGESIYIIYLLFLSEVALSYLLTYKRAILYVDQNHRTISTVHICYLVVLNALQIGTLLSTKNFYLYLVIRIVMRLVENIVLTVIANKRYPYLKDKVVSNLDAATRLDVYKKIRGLSYHKIASYIVLGTDNIVISIFFGVSVVGLYSNYLLVITAITMMVSQAFTAMTASIGNLLVNENHSKSFDVFRKIRFGNFWLACIATTSLLVMMNSFLTLWIGSQYLLPTGVLIALSINLYLTLIRSAIGSFKEAAGIFHEDRFVPVLESITNLIFSILFLKLFGLAGVFLGTACSTLLIHLYSYPKFVYKPLFKQELKLYYYQFFNYFFIAFVISGITFALSQIINLESNIGLFLANILLCIVVPNTILYIIYRKTTEFKYYIGLIKKSLALIKRH